MPNQRSLLQTWDVTLIKAMLEGRRFTRSTDILLYFNILGRNINLNPIWQIHKGISCANTPRATEEQLNAFLIAWPDRDAALI
jgi:hypothetical protein